jgi:flavin reductase (DIM6/NTAB) family NADH-FMN oxidoreductase RutF
MEKQAIPLSRLDLSVPKIFNRWLLLCAGDFLSGQYNAMTISWGSVGVMWEHPFVMVVVRPQRFTYQFIEHYDTFTVSAFPSQYKKALNLLGTKSGKDGNKIKEAGLTPVASLRATAPGFVEAELVLECRKMYFDDLDPAHFLAPDIEPNYEGDYHRIYYGEILAAQGTLDYRLS